MSALKLKDLIQPEFIQSLNKLRHHPEVKASLAFKLLPISKKVRSELENWDSLRIEVCRKHCQKNDDGSPIMIPAANGQTRFAFDENGQKLFDEELSGLAESNVDLPYPTVKVSELNDIKGLSIADLELLVGPVLIGE